MRRRIPIVLLLLLMAAVCLADSLCDQAMEAGKACFRNRKYQEALENFEYANQRCPSSETDNWISRCQAALNKQKQATTTAPSSTQQTTKPDARASMPAGQSPTSTTSTGATRSAATNNTSTSAKKSQKHSLTVSQTNLSFDEDGGKQTIIVSSDSRWRFTYGVHPDFQVAKEGTDKINVVCFSNQTTQVRTGYFDIFIGELDNRQINYRISLQQAAMQLFIRASVASSYIRNSGDNLTLTVTTNDPAWQLADHSAWIHQYNRQGNQLTLTFDANPAYEQRDGFIMLRTSDGRQVQTLHFHQAAKEPVRTYQSPSDRFLRMNGDYEVKWAQAGVAIGHPSDVELSICDFRIYWFELSLLNVGLQSNHRGWNVYWNPNLKAYVPFDSEWALTMSAGPRINFPNQPMDFDSYMQSSRLDNYSSDLFQMNRKVWFAAQMGFHWEWSDFWGTEFFVRYNGGFAIGATIDLHTGF